jgi:hypothetical protein
LMDWNFTLTVETFSQKALEQWPVLSEEQPDQDASRLLGWTHEKIRAAFTACPDGYLTADALRAAGLDLVEIAQARKLEWRRQRPAPMRPAMSLEVRRAVAEAAAINSKLGKIAAVYDAMQAVLTEGESGAGRIELRLVMDQAGARRVVVVHMQHHPAAWTDDLPVLMLNATARIEDVRRVFPRAVARQGPPVATPNTALIQITGGFSKSSMDGSPKKQADTKAFLTVAFPGYDCGIVGHKSSVAAFATMPNTRTTWHGANAGDDSFRNVDVGVVFDGPRARPAEIAALAAARTGHRVDSASPVMARETVLMTDGTGVEIPVLQYQDPRAQGIHASIHHAAIGQALARPRQVTRRASNPCLTLLFGNVAADRPVDVIIRWQDAKPDRLVHMVAGERVCLNAADMTAWHNKLFKSEKAASSARERFGDARGRIMAMISRDVRPWAEVRFQPAGQGQHIHTMFCPYDQIDSLHAEAARKYSRLVHWSARRITRGRDKALPIPLSLDLRAMGMTPGMIPAITAGALPPPAQRQKEIAMPLIE